MKVLQKFPMKTAKGLVAGLALSACAVMPVIGQQVTPVPFSAQDAPGAPNNPKVEVAWNRYYDYKGYTTILQNLNKAFPDLSDLRSIGKSHEGRDIYVFTVTNKKTGDHRTKPGMYIAGNIHANEVQTTEVTLYTAWYLLENYSRNEWIKNLVDTRTFYIIPTQSPDSRDKFMHEANTANSPRTGQVPRDDDGDGLFDEDKPDDLNGDGHITQMRKRVPMGEGTWKPHAEYPVIMVRCQPTEECEYEVLGQEGIDNDGDGRVNEDGDGSYDPNRNWGWNWEPNYTQRGADRFPFNLPETKAVSDFVKSHPNIIGGQSYHNTGGMILRGPGDRNDFVEMMDGRVMDQIGAIGEQQLPGYRYMIVWRDLYTVYGGETDWLYAAEGILPFVNEMWTPLNMFRTQPQQGGGGGGMGGGNTNLARFDHLLLFGDAYVQWEEVDHPQFGKVEVGGSKKNIGRMPPSFLLEEELHRNMAFTLHHAYQLPEVRVTKIETKSLGNGLTEVAATITNSRITPSRLQVDAKNNLTRPDWITLKGGKVLASGTRNNRFDETFNDHATGRPERVSIDFVPGNGSVIVVFVVQGNGPFEVEFDGVKSGKHSLKK